MSGSEAILVLEKARELAGRGDFRGSRAEAVRFACVELDAAHTDAVILLQRVCPMERMLQRIDQQVPSQSYRFRQRMLLDFDSAIAGLMDVVRSRRARIGKLAAMDADNWAGQSEAEKDKNWAEAFPKAVEEAKKVIPT